MSISVSAKFYPDDIIEYGGKGGKQGKVLDTNDEDQTVYVEWLYVGRREWVLGRFCRVLPPQGVTAS